MPTYRVKCGSNWVDIDADCPQSAVAKVKDMETFGSARGEGRFQVYELRFVTKHGPRGEITRHVPEIGNYLETIVAPTSERNP